MDKLKFLILSIAAISFCSIAVADSDSPGNAAEDKATRATKTVLVLVKTGSRYPNTPSCVSIECNYGDGFIEFIFPEMVDYLYVKVYDILFEFEGIVSKDFPTLEIPSLQGEYILECMTNDERLFKGKIVF